MLLIITCIDIQGEDEKFIGEKELCYSSKTRHMLSLTPPFFLRDNYAEAVAK